MNSKSVFNTIMIAMIAIFTAAFTSGEAAAQNTGYYPYVFARGADREIIRSMPIEARPSRPLHFYGNAVRRLNNPQPLQLPRFGILQPSFAPRNNMRFAVNPIFRR